MGELKQKYACLTCTYEYITESMALNNILEAVEKVKGFIFNVKLNREAFLLDTSTVNEWHATLLKHNPRVRPGFYRRRDASEVMSGEYLYLDSDRVPKSLHQYFDIFCTMADSVPVALDTKIKYTIRWAAWSLLVFLSIHPFLDGNGRVGRLICHYVLSSIIPIPLSIRGVYEAVVVSRPVYCSDLNEIIQKCNPTLLTDAISQSIISDCECFISDHIAE